MFEWYVCNDQFPKLHLSAKLVKLSGSVCGSPICEYKGGAAGEGSRAAVALCVLVQLGLIEPSQPLSLFVIKLEA